MRAYVIFKGVNFFEFFFLKSLDSKKLFVPLMHQATTKQKSHEKINPFHHLRNPLFFAYPLHWVQIRAKND